MQVREIMTRPVEVIPATAPLSSAAKKMRDHDVGMLPVHGEDNVAVGVVTDRDITIRAVAEGLDPTRTAVREVMTPDVGFIREDEDVTEAARLMETKQIRRALVLDSERRLTGIVSLGDLSTRVHGQQHELSSQVLERVSEPRH
jgi:CBS domain-containing protein